MLLEMLSGRLPGLRMACCTLAQTIIPSTHLYYLANLQERDRYRKGMGNMGKSQAQRPLSVHETRNQMTRYEELKPIRRAISSLRGKLYAFHLEISIVRERGCSLTRLLSSPPST